MLKKIRREILVALSMIGLKSASIKRNGHKYSIPLFHGMGRWLFFQKDKWRAKVFKTIPTTSQSNVVDIGINVGQSLLDFHEFMPEANYIGFEPNPACVFYLNELIRRNAFRNKTILPFGLNEKKEVLKLMSKGWDDASSSVVSHRGNFYETTIYTTTGDDAISDLGIKSIDFIKVDVEGFELSVLRGLKNTLTNYQPIVFCEVNEGSDNQKELFDFVCSLGYQIYAPTKELKAFQVMELPLKERHANDFVLIHPSKVEAWLKLLNNV